jgi:hypothetical protein
LDDIKLYYLQSKAPVCITGIMVLMDRRGATAANSIGDVI